MEWLMLEKFIGAPFPLYQPTEFAACIAAAAPTAAVNLCVHASSTPSANAYGNNAW